MDPERKKKSLAARLKKSVVSRAVRYFSTPEGMATFNKALDAKKKADRFLADVYQTAGLPSLLDKQQVEWAVDRQLHRLRDLNVDLDQVEEALKRLERAVAEAQKAAPQPALEAAAPAEAAPSPAVSEPPPPEPPAASEAPPAGRTKPPAAPKPAGAKTPPKPAPRREVVPLVKKAAAPKPKPATPPTKAAKPKPATTPARTAKPKPAKRAAVAPAKPKPLGAVGPKAALGSRSLLDLNWKGKPKKKSR